MHESSMQLMEQFVRQYLPIQGREFLSVADVGSCDINGCYRPLFEGCAYTGLDIQEGPNVDRVVEEYDFGDTQYDLVISGQCLEHVEDMHRWRDAVVRILRPGGLLFVTAPHSWPHHPFPRDCWRIFPDGMKWLFRELEVLVCDMNGTDTWIVAHKPLAE